MQPIHYLVLPSPYLAIYSHYLAPVVPKQGGDGGIIISPPIFQIFANVRSKIPSEGLKTPKINENSKSSP